MQSPDMDRLRVLQDWLERPAYGNAFLQGVEARAWDAEARTHEFLLVGSKHETDVVTKWLRKFISGTYHNLLGYRIKRTGNRSDASIYNYNEANLVQTIHTLSVVLSSLVPTASMFALYYTHSTSLRLVLVMIFTSLFALVLSIFTKARRVELFAATAA